MDILNRESFLALEGSVLFSEVVLVTEGDNTFFAPKPHTDPLMIRKGHNGGTTYYESSIVEFSLSDLFTYRESGVWKVIEKELDLTASRGCHENEYYLVYSKDDVRNIVKELLECL